MTKSTVLFTTMVGIGLAGSTALLARGPVPSGAPAAASVPQGRTRLVAAEGRVVTYPGGEVIVGTERGGRLARVLVEESQPVRKGDLLVEIDGAEIAAALNEARARVREAEAEVRLAESTLARREGLQREQVISVQDLDQARRDLDTARARQETARASVARYEAQLRQTRIVAPISGTVIARHVHPGETVDTGRRVVTLANLDRLRIEAEADEADAGVLKVGALATITADGQPGRSWKGRVEEIPTAVTIRRLKPQDPSRATDTRVLAVKVAFAEPVPLRLGTTVELRIEAAPE